MDDLGGLNSDTFIKISNSYDPVTNDTFTVRYQAHSIAAAGLVAGDKGVDDGPWVVNPPMEFDDPAFPTDNPVDPNAPPSDSNGCSCSTSPDGSVDPLLPALLLASLIYLGWRAKQTDAE